jgi:zeta-carotene desaturase
VISTVPWHDFAILFEGSDGARTMPAPLAEVADTAARMRSMPILTVNLWYDRPVMHEPFVGLPGCTIQWVFEKRAIFGERCSHLSLIVSSAAAVVGESTETLVALAAREVASRIEGARHATLVRGTVIRERQATFCTAQADLTRPDTRTGVDGLYLAGDWINTGLPSTIESAVISGRMAAEAAMTKSDVQSSIPD